MLNCPGTNIEAVAEHALGLYFAGRRKVGELDAVVKERRIGIGIGGITAGGGGGGIVGEWVEKGTCTGRWDSIGGPPLGCRQEVVGIVGYGRLGRRIESLCAAVGMGRVVVAARKGDDVTATGLLRLEGERGGNGVVERVRFEEMLRMVTVLVICCPRDASTIDLIGEVELRSMRKQAIIVNVARGGIVNEAALAKALTERWIAGAATDVLETEPGGRGTTPLLPLEGELPNLTVTPHVAWFAAQTMTNLKDVLKDGLEAWLVGKPINVVVQGR